MKNIFERFRKHPEEETNSNNRLDADEETVKFLNEYLQEKSIEKSEESNLDIDETDTEAIEALHKIVEEKYFKRHERYIEKHAYKLGHKIISADYLRGDITLLQQHYDGIMYVKENHLVLHNIKNNTTDISHYFNDTCKPICVAQLPHGNTLFSDDSGYCTSNGSDWHIVEWRDITRSDSKVTAIQQLSDKEIVVGGKNALLFVCNPLNRKRHNLRFCQGFDQYSPDVNALCKISDRNFLVGGSKGGLFDFKYRGGKLYGELVGLVRSEKTCSHVSVKAIERLSDDRAMVGGFGGALYLYDKNGPIKFCKIKGFKDENGELATINTIRKLSNGLVMIGGDNGTLYTFNPENKTLSDRIDGFKNKKGTNMGILSICELSNGNIIVGGQAGMLYNVEPYSETAKELLEERKKFHHD